MANLPTFALITVGVLILFYISGINQSTTLSSLGLLPSNMQNFNSSYLYLKIFLVIGLLAGISGIAMGLFGQNVFETALTATLATPLAVLITSLSAITTYAGTSGIFFKYFVWAITAPLVVMYLISLYDWVRGK